MMTHEYLSERREILIVYEKDEDEYDDSTSVSSYNRDEKAINSVDHLQAVFLEVESLFPAVSVAKHPHEAASLLGSTSR